MSTIVSILAVVVLVASVVIVLGVVEFVTAIVAGERGAARAALRREYEDRKIDAEAFAKGLRAFDENRAA